MATTLPDRPPPDDARLLELVVGSALDELLVVDDEVVLDVEVEVSLDSDVLGSDVVEAVVREVVVELSVVAVVGGAADVVGTVGEALVRLTGVSGREVLADVAALPAVPADPLSAGTVTGARVTLGTVAEVVAAPDVTAGAGSDAVTALPQAASSRAVMP